MLRVYAEFFIANSKDIKYLFEIMRRAHMYVHFNKGLSTLAVPLSIQVHLQIYITKFNAEGNPVMD